MQAAAAVSVPVWQRRRAAHRVRPRVALACAAPPSLLRRSQQRAADSWSSAAHVRRAAACRLLQAASARLRLLLRRHRSALLAVPRRRRAAQQATSGPHTRSRIRRSAPPQQHARESCDFALSHHQRCPPLSAVRSAACSTRKQLPRTQRRRRAESGRCVSACVPRRARWGKPTTQLLHAPRSRHVAS